MIGNHGIKRDVSNHIGAVPAEGLGRQFFDAVGSGDGTLLSRLITANGVAGTELDSYENEAGETLLSCAVRRCDVDMAELLIKAGANVDRPDRQGWTALHLAAYRGSLRIAGLLLTRGADLSIPVGRGQFRGMAPLHLAAIKGHEEVATALLKFGADGLLSVAVGNSEGWNALHLCAALGHVDVLDALMRAGVSVDAPVRRGKAHGLTALHIAAANGAAAVVASLLQTGCDMAAAVQSGKYAGWNALHFAVRRNHGGVAGLLIDAGANVSTPIGAGPYAGRDALQIAVRYGYADLVARLLGAGVDCNPGLRWALAREDWAFAKLFIECLPFEAVTSLDLAPVFGEAPPGEGFASNRYRIRQQRLAQMVGMRYLSEIADHADGTDPLQKELFARRLAGTLAAMSLSDRARALAAIVFASTAEDGVPPYACVLHALFLLDDLEGPPRDLLRKDIIDHVRLLDLGRVQVDSHGTRDGFVLILAGEDKIAWVPWLTRQLLRQLRYP